MPRQFATTLPLAVAAVFTTLSLSLFGPLFLQRLGLINVPIAESLGSEPYVADRLLSFVIIPYLATCLLSSLARARQAIAPLIIFPTSAAVSAAFSVLLLSQRSPSSDALTYIWFYWSTGLTAASVLATIIYLRYPPRRTLYLQPNLSMTSTGTLPLTPEPPFQLSLLWIVVAADLFLLQPALYLSLRSPLANTSTDAFYGTAIVVHIVFAFGIAVLLYSKGRLSLAQLRLHGFRVGSIGLVLGMLALQLAFVVTYFEWVFSSSILVRQPIPAVAQYSLVEALASIVVGPFIEEAIYRGVLFAGFAAHYGPRLSLLGTSFLFAAVHLDGPNFVPYLLFGAILAAVRHETRSLWPSVVLHSLFNVLI